SFGRDRAVLWFDWRPRNRAQRVHPGLQRISVVCPRRGGGKVLAALRGGRAGSLWFRLLRVAAGALQESVVAGDRAPFSRRVHPERKRSLSWIARDRVVWLQRAARCSVDWRGVGEPGARNPRWSAARARRRAMIPNCPARPDGQSPGR